MAAILDLVNFHRFKKLEKMQSLFFLITTMFQMGINKKNTFNKHFALKYIRAYTSVKVSIVGSLRDRAVACSASDRQGSNLESCVWRTVSSHSSHHPQDILLAQFILYVHKCGLKPDSFHFKVKQQIVIISQISTETKQINNFCVYRRVFRYT